MGAKEITVKDLQNKDLLGWKLNKIGYLKLSSELGLNESEMLFKVQDYAIVDKVCKILKFIYGVEGGEYHPVERFTLAGVMVNEQKRAFFTIQDLKEESLTARPLEFKDREHFLDLWDQVKSVLKNRLEQEDFLALLLEEKKKEVREEFDL
ncbi:MAG TPA: hypothetical protein VKP03_00540 [Patescibacteria group bacterium]|nr:hypothetical protein [Patescibacteria group bacterium]